MKEKRRRRWLAWLMALTMVLSLFLPIRGSVAGAAAPSDIDAAIAESADAANPEESEITVDQVNPEMITNPEEVVEQETSTTETEQPEITVVPAVEESATETDQPEIVTVPATEDEILVGDTQLDNVLNVPGGALSFQNDSSHPWATSVDQSQPDVDYAVFVNYVDDMSSSVTLEVDLPERTEILFDVWIDVKRDDTNGCYFEIDQRRHLMPLRDPGREIFEEEWKNVPEFLRPTYYPPDYEDPIWETKYFVLEAGHHVLKWRYIKWNGYGEPLEQLERSEEFRLDNVRFLTLDAPSQAKLDGALNITGGTLSFQNDADYPWTVATDPETGRNYAASANRFADSQSALTLEVDLTDSAEIIFDDFLRCYDISQTAGGYFYVDGEICRFVKPLAKGENPAWTENTFVLPAGHHKLEWKFVRNGTGSYRSDVFFVEYRVDNVRLRHSASGMADAVYYTGPDDRFFTNDETNPWVIETANGRTYAKCGNVGQNYSSSTLKMEVTLNTQSYIGFSYYISSQNTDFGYFVVDGTRQSTYKGTRNERWGTDSISLSSGKHTLEWIYEKDADTHEGDDCFCVDDICISNTKGVIAITGEEEIYLPKSGQRKLDITVLPQYAEYTMVGYTSGNSNIASVDDTGLVKGISAGDTTITIRSMENLDVTKTVTVHVLDQQELTEAVNHEDGEWVCMSIGDYPWTVVTDDERTYAKSGNAGVSSSVSKLSMTVNVTEACKVGFDCRISCESYNDKGQFYVDGVLIREFTGDSKGWRGYLTEDTISAGYHTLEWRYEKNEATDAREDCFCIDNVCVGSSFGVTSVEADDEITVAPGFSKKLSWQVLPLYAENQNVTFQSGDTSVVTVDRVGTLHGVAEGTTTVTITSADNADAKKTVTVTVSGSPDFSDAANFEGEDRKFTTGGDYPWFVVEEYGRKYVKAGNTGVNKSTSSMTLTVNLEEESRIGFTYKISSESATADPGLFLVDDRIQLKVGGTDNIDWQKYTYTLSAGTHKLEWRYRKDDSTHSGSDSFCVDDILIDTSLAKGIIGDSELEIPLNWNGSYEWDVVGYGTPELSVTSQNPAVAKVVEANSATLYGVSLGTTTIRVAFAENPSIYVDVEVSVTNQGYSPVEIYGLATNFKDGLNTYSRALVKARMGSPERPTLVGALPFRPACMAYANGYIYGYDENQNFFRMSKDKLSKYDLYRKPYRASTGIQKIVALCNSEKDGMLYGVAEMREAGSLWLVKVNPASGSVSGIAGIPSGDGWSCSMNGGGIAVGRDGKIHVVACYSTSSDNSEMRELIYSPTTGELFGSYTGGKAQADEKSSFCYDSANNWFWDVKDGLHGFSGENQITSRDYFGGTYTVDHAFIVPAAQTAKPANNPFTDVKASKFYADAVLWAYNADPQITTGIAENQFKPNNDCTRAEVVTFLWRLAGKPEPGLKTNPFKDVSKKHFAYKAVLWAVENGITTGTSPTTFDPSGKCTRGDFVTFLYRTYGEPAHSVTSSPFSDVKSNKKYWYNPVMWAVENEITTGKYQGLFAPKDLLSRGEVATFIFRAYLKFGRP